VSKLTDKELRELDAWIAENVFGLPVNWEDGRRENGPVYLWFIAGKNGESNQCERVKNYTTDPAAAMEVLKKCIGALPLDNESDPEDMSTFSLGLRRGYGGKGGFAIRRFSMWMETYSAEEIGEGETLELAIAKFARSLFSK
jgi:hypothetical protein